MPQFVGAAVPSVVYVLLKTGISEPPSYPTVAVIFAPLDA
jgi:hypothetical protein